jgi:hypothetical protein
MLPPYVIITNRIPDSLNGIAIFPFVFINKKNYERYYKDFPNQYKTLINHETVHTMQQVECLVIPFYLFYFISYLINRVKGYGGFHAYRNNIFEMEAYDNEHDLTYLGKRKWFAWTKYIFKKKA